ncbi:MAG TPA: hypothetical protein DGG94_08080 [Micromonosporaceae bacterium]|nr:hypothetical protein [Micromonosporaceae bacterium]HCU49743.1 hypothetical protein [Micromonosporaceae bacterium]
MASLVQVELPNGQVIWARVSTDGPSDVAHTGVQHHLNMDELRVMMAGISETVRSTLENLRPDDIRIEFGLELTVKSGKLISVLAEASSTASVTVSLGWQTGVSGTLNM